MANITWKNVTPDRIAMTAQHPDLTQDGIYYRPCGAERIYFIPMGWANGGWAGAVRMLPELAGNVSQGEAVVLVAWGKVAAEVMGLC